MSKSIALGLLGTGAILLAILLTGCSDAPSPTPSAGDGATPTGTAQPEITPTPTPAAATLSLGVYLTLCASTEEELADDTTFGDFSSLYAAAADRFEALTPPARLSEWHLLLIEAIRAAQAGVDTQPQDDVVDFDNPTMNAVFDDLEEKLREAAARLPEDVLQQMIEAGCIDPELVPDDYADVPDDHGNSEGDATAIRVGTEVRGAVDYDDDIDFFRFQAERGQSYQIDVALGTLDDSELVLLGPDGRELAYNDDYGDTYASRLYWEAPSSGERYVVVWGADISSRGTYTLTVSLSDLIDDHGNSEGDATAIRVGADVRGAVDYDDDIDFFRFQAERGQSYQIDVALGTLDDSIVDLYDADGSYLDASYDYGDPYASRLYWEAPSSGERYVAVYGYGTGTYTLTVSHSTIVDDHGDDIDDATVAATPLSLDEYLSLCVTTELELADDATFGDLSSELAAEADRFEALTPPAQLSEWHLLNIEGFRTIQAFVELQPKDDVIDFGRFFLMAAISADSEEKLREAAARLPEDILQQMIEAGCIDPEDLPDNYEAVPDDHGNDIGDATAIRVGADVRGAVDYDDDIDFFRFQAERGQSYQIDVALGTLDDSIVDLYDVDWSYLDSNDDYETFASRLYWEAPSSGERYVAVEGYGTGTYTLTVSLVDDHGDTAEDGVGVASDRAALVALYNATEGGSWNTRTNWLSDRPIGEWHGVTTDSGGRVTALNLVSNRLVGALPAALGDLTNLRTLILWTNDELTGPIPAWLGDLTNLRRLILGGNGLTGEIPPELAGLSNLTSLDLRGNGLTGEIPPELAGLSNLQRLYLNHNRLTGEIPPELASLSNLTELYLNDNRLTGEIPPELGRLSNLMELGLYANQLTGEIPPELASLSNLTELGLYANQLTGEIPPELGGLSNLTSLILNSNRLTGGIPPELGGLSNLDFLWLRGNQLTGCIPEGLRDIESNDLGHLNLPDCGLEGRPTAGSFVSVSAGYEHTCGVRSDGSVACWGYNGNGQATPPADSFDSVSGGGDHTCGVRSDGSVACWGLNSDGQATPPAGSFVSVSSGGFHTCGVRSDGSAACWGSGVAGRDTPPAGSFLSVSAGYGHTCGVRSEGSVACWGSNTAFGEFAGQATPPAGPFVSVSAGWKHTCGLMSEGSVACWGSNTAFGEFAGQATPPAGPFVSVSAGLDHTCGLRSGGSVACWGYNGSGAATPPAGSFVSVSGGGDHTCGVRSDGSVACWGWNTHGQATPPE